MAIFRYIKKALSLITEIIYIHFYSLFSAGRDEKGKMKLVTVRTDALGDFILWISYHEQMRAKFPSDKYTTILVCDQTVAEFANKIGLYDEVIPLDMKRFRESLRYRLNFFKKMLDSKFAIAINPMYSRNLIGDILMLASNAPVRIGFDGDIININPSLKWLTDKWYTKKIMTVETIRMELVRNRDFLREIGIDDAVASIADLRKYVAVDNTSEAYFVVVPGAGNAKRNWPIERFAKVLEYVGQKTGWECIVCGGSGEETLANSLDRMVHNTKLHNLIGKTNIYEYICILGGANIVIANESSAIHIAAAMQIPAVCVAGGGHFTRFADYGDIGAENAPILVFSSRECFNCNWQCTEDEANTWPCISSVSSEMVLNKLKFLVGGKGQK